MKKTFNTPEGSITRDLTEEEIKKFAASGDSEAKEEICRQDYLKAVSLQDKIEALAKFVGVV